MIEKKIVPVIASRRGRLVLPRAGVAIPRVVLEVVIVKPPIKLS
jgi:hypothetical protein